MIALYLALIPVVMLVIALLVVRLVVAIKKTKLNNQIRKTIYSELVLRSGEKTPKELEEYMKIIKKY